MFWTEKELILLWFYTSLSSRDSWYIVSADEDLYDDLCFIESQLLVANKLLYYYEDGQNVSIICLNDLSNLLSTEDTFIDDLLFHPLNFESLLHYRIYLESVITI